MNMDDATKLWLLEEMQREQAEFEAAVFSESLDVDVYVTLALDLDVFPS